MIDVEPNSQKDKTGEFLDFFHQWKMDTIQDIENLISESKKYNYILPDLKKELNKFFKDQLNSYHEIEKYKQV